MGMQSPTPIIQRYGVKGFSSRFMVHRNGVNQVIGAGTIGVQFTTKPYDDLNEYDNVGGTWRFTPTRSGWYQLACSIVWTGLLLNDHVGLRLSTTTGINTLYRHLVDNVALLYIPPQSICCYLSSNDSAIVYAVNWMGANRTLDGARAYTFFCGHRLS